VNITSAFLGLILAFLVIPIFSLTLDTPLFYVNRGVKIPAAVLLLLGALVAFWLIFFLFFYLVSSFLARIIQPNQLGRLVIFVEVLYLTFCAVDLNISLFTSSRTMQLIITVLFSVMAAYVSAKLLLRKNFGMYLMSSLVLAFVCRDFLVGISRR